MEDSDATNSVRHMFYHSNFLSMRISLYFIIYGCHCVWVHHLAADVLLISDIIHEYNIFCKFSCSSTVNITPSLFLMSSDV